jgi:hypothetical protein
MSYSGIHPTNEHITSLKGMRENGYILENGRAYWFIAPLLYIGIFSLKFPDIL